MRPGSGKFTFISVLLALLIGAMPAYGQESGDTGFVDVRPEPRPAPSSPSALRFVEIELTAEGVIAYDSAGGRWAYDFERHRFVSAPLEAGSEAGGREAGDRDEVVPPVAVRCTERKVVDYPALTAVYVGYDEFVDGDIVAYSRVTVKGWVKGKVQSFSKAVLIASTGQVDGDVQAPQVEIREGGVVLGRVIETPTYEIPVDVIASGFSMAGIWVVFGISIGILLIAFLTLSLAPMRVANFTECIENHPVKSSFMGLLFLFLLPIIVTLVCLTVVGLLVVWLVPLAYFVAFAVGMCAVGMQVYTFAARRLGRHAPGTWLGSLAGVAFYVGLWTLTAFMLGAASGHWLAADALSVFLLVISIILTCYPLLAGIGAAVMTRMGGRPYVKRTSTATRHPEPAPAPAPPPMPEAMPPVEPRTPRPPIRPMPSDPSAFGPPDSPEN
ncbi:MAG: polymer-forming cytoskeletal protein [Candidatus Zixiibacteriota bacterium]